MIPIAIKLFLGGVFKRLSGLFGLFRGYASTFSGSLRY